MAIEEPNIYRPVVASVDFILGIGAKAMELRCPEPHAASAGGVGDVMIIGRIGNSGNDEILPKFAGGDIGGWIRPNAEGAGPICKPTGRVIRTKKDVTGSDVLIRIKVPAPSELNFKRGSDLKAIVVFVRVDQ